MASDEHLHELISQLQLMGECILIPSTSNDPESDLVVFQPEWLCSRILGRLLCHERFFQVSPQNLNGIYKLSELKQIYADLCTDVNLLKAIFLAFKLCAEWEDCVEYCVSGDLVYEFAALNFLSEPLPLAFKLVKQYSSSVQEQPQQQQSTFFITNGFQIRESAYHLDNSARMGLRCTEFSQLASLFFIVQVSLRSLTNSFNADSDVARLQKQVCILKYIYIFCVPLYLIYIVIYCYLGDNILINDK